MLGELIAESSGKMTGIRVLSAEGPVAKLEVSLQGSGKLLGQEMTSFITYWQTIRAGGEFYGEGQEVVMTADGEMATWTGFAVGRPTGKGSAGSFRGSGSFQTASEKLARLNGVVTVFEHEADEDGNYSYKEWEWK
jgi:hypothetical protein